MSSIEVTPLLKSCPNPGNELKARGPIVDPVSLILGALTSGAAQGVAESTANSVKDAYSKLKSLLSRRFAGSVTAELALAQHADDPETWRAPLVKALTESGASTDSAVIKAAQRLMALLDDAGTQAGKYNIDLRRAQGVQVGDGSQQLNVFTTRPEIP